ncbi:hypothetical protein AFA91_07265 [Mycolicibacterium goodii]|uniref:Uncharacterized protein n=2 Tax=Mycolicibacterium goodii TaxID=134601 RepID=A0A0K0X2Y2_MYCGD|nr:hypothetical protein AFA91_07265 [Mycolicibacterium goodii]
MWAVVTVLRGSYVTAILCVAGAAWWTIPAVVQFIMPGLVPRVTCDNGETTIRPDRRLDRMMLIATLGGAPLFGLCAVLSALGRLDLPMSSAGSEGGLFAWVPIICGGLAGVFAVFFALIVKLGGIGYLRLGPEGFERAEAFRKTAKRHWDEVTDVSDTAPDRPQAISPLVIATDDGQQHSIDNSAMYTGEGRTLYEFVRFYWLHPERRIELTDGRATERFLQVQSAADRRKGSGS